MVTFLINWLKNFGDYYKILIGWFFKLSVQTFQTLIFIYRRGNFVYYHWGCASYYRPLSYPFRSLYTMVQYSATPFLTNIFNLLYKHFYKLFLLFKFFTNKYIFKFLCELAYQKVVCLHPYCILHTKNIQIVLI